MAGVDAASEAALLLDFLGHVCCGVSRRRPLQERDAEKSRIQAAGRICFGETPRGIDCAPAKPASPRFVGYLITARSSQHGYFATAILALAVVLSPLTLKSETVAAADVAVVD